MGHYDHSSLFSIIFKNYFFDYSLNISQRFFVCSNLDELTYHHIADETMESLTEFFDDLGDMLPQGHQDYDVTFGVSDHQLHFLILRNIPLRACSPERSYLDVRVNPLAPSSFLAKPDFQIP